MNKPAITLGVIGAILFVVFIAVAETKLRKDKSINSFQECVAAGNPILESYPAQCKTKDGRTFIEDIGNELEKSDLIRVDSPRPNATLSNPVVVKGEARGYWFFEASFPIELRDSEGNTLAIAIAQAEGEWMTTEFVPFSVQFSFATTTAQSGVLILHKDNPSGLPEHDDELRIPVRFSF